MEGRRESGVSREGFTKRFDVGKGRSQGLEGGKMMLNLFRGFGDRAEELEEELAIANVLAVTDSGSPISKTLPRHGGC